MSVKASISALISQKNEITPEPSVIISFCGDLISKKTYIKDKQVIFSFCHNHIKLQCTQILLYISILFYYILFITVCQY